MVRSMGFKQSLRLAVAFASLTGVGSAVAVGIPVYCFNCEQASYAAANAILDGQRSQTEALLNAFDYTMRTSASLQTAMVSKSGVTQQRVQNAYKMDPSIAKPRLACSQSSAATVRAGSTGAVRGLKNALTAKTIANNTRNINLPPGESRKEYSVKNVLAVLGADDAVDPSTVIMSQSPIPNDTSTIVAYRKTKDAVSNPFPVEMPAAEEVARIKAHGSAGEKEGLAQMLAIVSRQTVAQSVLDEDQANRIQIIKSDTVQDQLSYMTEAMDDDTKKLWTTGTLSNYQMEELATSYRANSPTWIKQTSSGASEMALLKDTALMTAELLKQLGINNRLLRISNQLAALRDSREASQQGMQTR